MTDRPLYTLYGDFWDTITEFLDVGSIYRLTILSGSPQMAKALRNRATSANFEYRSGFIDLNALWRLLSDNGGYGLLSRVTEVSISSNTGTRCVSLPLSRPTPLLVFPSIVSLSAHFYGAIDLFLMAYDLPTLMPNLNHLDLSGDSAYKWPFLEEAHFPTKLVSLRLSCLDSLSITPNGIANLPRTLQKFALSGGTWIGSARGPVLWPESLSDFSLNILLKSQYEPSFFNSLPTTLTRLSISGRVDRGLDCDTASATGWRLRFPSMQSLDITHTDGFAEGRLLHVLDRELDLCELNGASTEETRIFEATRDLVLASARSVRFGGKKAQLIRYRWNSGESSETGEVGACIDQNTHFEGFELSHICQLQLRRMSLPFFAFLPNLESLEASYVDFPLGTYFPSRLARLVCTSVFVSDLPQSLKLLSLKECTLEPTASNDDNGGSKRQGEEPLDEENFYDGPILVQSKDEDGVGEKGEYGEGGRNRAELEIAPLAFAFPPTLVTFEATNTHTTEALILSLPTTIEQFYAYFHTSPARGLGPGSSVESDMFPERSLLGDVDSPMNECDKAWSALASRFLNLRHLTLYSKNIRPNRPLAPTQSPVLRTFVSEMLRWGEKIDQIWLARLFPEPTRTGESPVFPTSLKDIQLLIEAVVPLTLIPFLPRSTTSFAATLGPTLTPFPLFHDHGDAKDVSNVVSRLPSSLEVLCWADPFSSDSDRSDPPYSPDLLSSLPRSLHTLALPETMKFEGDESRLHERLPPRLSVLRAAPSLSTAYFTQSVNVFHPENEDRLPKRRARRG